MCKARTGSNRLYVSFGGGFTASIRVFQAFDAAVTSVVFGRDSFWAGYAKRDQGVGGSTHHVMQKMTNVWREELFLSRTMGRKYGILRE